MAEAKERQLLKYVPRPDRQSILSQTNERNEARSRAKTGNLSPKTLSNNNKIYPWEQRQLQGENQKKKLKANWLDEEFENAFLRIDCQIWIILPWIDLSVWLLIYNCVIQISLNNYLSI